MKIPADRKENLRLTLVAVRGSSMAWQDLVRFTQSCPPKSTELFTAGIYVGENYSRRRISMR